MFAIIYNWYITTGFARFLSSANKLCLAFYMDPLLVLLCLFFTCRCLWLNCLIQPWLSVPCRWHAGLHQCTCDCLTKSVTSSCWRHHTFWPMDDVEHTDVEQWILIRPIWANLALGSSSPSSPRSRRHRQSYFVKSESVIFTWLSRRCQSYSYRLKSVIFAVAAATLENYNGENYRIGLPLKVHSLFPFRVGWRSDPVVFRYNEWVITIYTICFLNNETTK